jgi:hypothetical protein
MLALQPVFRNFLKAIVLIQRDFGLSLSRIDVCQQNAAIHTLRDESHYCGKVFSAPSIHASSVSSEEPRSLVPASQ